MGKKLSRTIIIIVTIVTLGQIIHFVLLLDLDLFKFSVWFSDFLPPEIRRGNTGKEPTIIVRPNTVSKIHG